MNTNDTFNESSASQSCDASICSLPPFATLVHLEFNLFEEATRLNIYEKYYDRASSLGISFDRFYTAVNSFLESTDNIFFDEKYLKPNDFKYFCNLLDISFKELSDEYYKFVLIKDFSKIILNTRISLNLTQKEFAAKCRLSPVSIGKFENKLKYPSRNQYYHLKEVMKLQL